MPDSQHQESRDPLDERVRERTAELAGANERLQTELGQLLDAVPDLIWRAEIDDTKIVRFEYGSSRLEPLTGRTIESFGELPAAWFEIIHPEDRPRMVRLGMRLMSGESDREEAEYRIVRPDETIRWVRDTTVVTKSPDGVRHMQATVSDITALREAESARERAEDTLRQAQKMEAVGILAGGVAHDFNNLLTVIRGNAELLLAEIHSDDPNKEYVRQIKIGADKATHLTRQLLAFSRKQILEPRVFDLQDTVTDVKSMLERLIGEDIEVRLETSTISSPVMADPSQMDQVILNLAVNARDAMPYGGTLTLELSNSGPPDEAGLGVAEAPAWVSLSVTDTGRGMDEEHLAHVFEPFFTTKEVGKGTGLGLSTVHGIVTQSGGSVSVRSEVGVGTTFTVYLPRATKEGVPAVEEAVEPEVVAGSETILLVEDDESVRLLIRRTLEKSGFQVLEAESGERAIRVSEEYDGTIDLLLTDVVMPKMSGWKVAERVRGQRAGIEVLYMSGYSEAAIKRRDDYEPGAALITKIFTPSELVRAINSQLVLR